MGRKSYFDEIQRALARSDVDEMIRQIDAYVEFVRGSGADDHSHAFAEISFCCRNDPDKALAYVMIAASRIHDAEVLSQFACGPLENLLDDPSTELLERIVVEARKSARFRWLLSHPFKVAIADRAWKAIEPFRISGPHEEPALNTLPPP